MKPKHTRVIFFIQNTGWSNGTSWFDGTKVFYTKKEADDYLKNHTKIEGCLYRVVKETVNLRKYSDVITRRYYKAVGKLLKEN